MVTFHSKEFEKYLQKISWQLFPFIFKSKETFVLKCFSAPSLKKLSAAWKVQIFSIKMSLRDNLVSGFFGCCRKRYFLKAANISTCSENTWKLWRRRQKRKKQLKSFFSTWLDWKKGWIKIHRHILWILYSSKNMWYHKANKVKRRILWISQP